MKEMPDLICGKAAVGGNYNSTRDIKTEKDGVENAEFFFEGDTEVINNQLRFSDSNISLNRICHHMEKKIDEIDNKVLENEFDLEKFLKIFVTEKPNETSKLYIEIRKRLIELAEENSKLYKQLVVDDDNSDESREERISHYRYFYIYARNELLKICKLSEEKSVNK
ncbi:MAG: hypothetical protein SPF19_01535, partial [Oliverpabstia sp.]|nr:hypothetical protein [Oliverpabstia sp.]